MTEKRSGWGDNPSGLYAGIDWGKEPSQEGPAMVHSRPEGKQIPKDTIVKDLLELVRRMPLSDTQVEELYLAIEGRARHKVCDKCKKLRVVFGGRWEIHPSLDLTKPKSFICKECV